MIFLLLGADDTPMTGEQLFNLGCETQDPIQALRYFTSSAEQDYIAAWNNIGWAYEHGIGVTPDETKAIEAYQKAQNDFTALFNLAIIYARKTNWTTALQYIQKAANHSDISEMEKSLTEYLKTENVPQDSKKKAYLLLKLAEDQNIQNASELLALFPKS